MDMHCQYMAILKKCRMRPVEIPLMTVWPHFLCPADMQGPADIPCMSVRDIRLTCCVHFTDICQGLLRSFCHNVNYGRNTRCLTDAINGQSAHASRTNTLCAHTRRGGVHCATKPEGAGSNHGCISMGVNCKNTRVPCIWCTLQNPRW